MIQTIVETALTLATALVIGVTLLPLWASKRWWVRMWDFPRVQIAVVCVAVGVASLVLPDPGRPLVFAAMLACALYHGWRIRPYTRLARIEMQLAPEAETALTLLSVNVLMENDRHADMRALVERVDPDAVLFMEVDQAWLEALEPVLARYPTVVREPRDDYYGMVFATRLETREARTVHLTEDETPALFAELVAPGGTPFRFIGLHPQPPVPGEDSDERDAQILYAARFAREAGMPLVTMGDFNDVAWSHTARRFKRVGPYLDPRVGRGFYSSFDANRWYLRFPLDQFYATEGVAVVWFRRGAHVGSDHFPMIARIRIDTDLAGRLNVASPEMTEADQEEIEAQVATYRARLGEGAFVPGGSETATVPAPRDHILS